MRIAQKNNVQVYWYYDLTPINSYSCYRRDKLWKNMYIASFDKLIACIILLYIASQLGVQKPQNHDGKFCGKAVNDKHLANCLTLQCHSVYTPVSIPCSSHSIAIQLCATSLSANTSELTPTASYNYQLVYGQ